MLNIDIETEISSECASFVLCIIFDKVQSDFSTLLGVFRLFEIDGLDACPALHFEEQCSHQVPCFLQVVMFD
jgi:hypothetical protein